VLRSLGLHRPHSSSTLCDPRAVGDVGHAFGRLWAWAVIRPDSTFVLVIWVSWKLMDGVICTSRASRHWHESFSKVLSSHRRMGPYRPAWRRRVGGLSWRGTCEQWARLSNAQVASLQLRGYGCRGAEIPPCDSERNRTSQKNRIRNFGSEQILLTGKMIVRVVDSQLFQISEARTESLLPVPHGTYCLLLH